jgi:hypothetical protein
MVILPSEIWANVLVGNGLGLEKYRKNEGPHAEKCKFRQPPPTTANHRHFLTSGMRGFW